jgi:hypothetical protein
VSGPFFHSGPNSHSSFPINIKFKAANKVEIRRISPHSRFAASIVDDKNKIILFYTYKVGSSTIKKFIKENMQEVFPGVDYSKKNPQDIEFPSLLNTHVYRDPGKHFITTINWEKYNDYRKILFMRDPLDKLVSFYTMVFVRGVWNFIDKPHFRNGYTLKTLGYFVPETGTHKVDVFDISFKQVLDRLYNYYEKGVKVWDSHLSLQVTPDISLVAGKKLECYNVNLLSDFLLKWAKSHNINLSEDAFKVAGSNINIHKKNEPIKDAFNLTVRDFKKHGFTPPYTSFYNSKLKKKAEEIYKSDLKYWSNCKNELNNIF